MTGYSCDTSGLSVIYRVCLHEYLQGSSRLLLVFEILEDLGLAFFNRAFEPMATETDFP